VNFTYTILYVSDVSRTVSFYEKAFGLKKRFIHESGDYAEMETGATTLSFTSNELAQSNLPAGFRENDLSHPPAGIEIVPELKSLLRQTMYLSRLRVR
jgi:predicted enzyme related to lactoylglutathione lyase